MGKKNMGKKKKKTSIQPPTSAWDVREAWHLVFIHRLAAGGVGTHVHRGHTALRGRTATLPEETEFSRKSVEDFGSTSS